MNEIWNIGFCLGEYEKETCGDCLSEKECLIMQEESRKDMERRKIGLRASPRIEYGDDPPISVCTGCGGQHPSHVPCSPGLRAAILRGANASDKILRAKAIDKLIRAKAIDKLNNLLFIRK